MKKILISLMICGLLASAGRGFAKEVSVENLAGIPSAAVVEEGVVTGGTPTAEGLSEARKRGVGIVIDLRTEPDLTAAEEKVVTDLGMTYHNIPVSTPDAIGAVETAKLGEILSGRGDTGVLLHCASGRRANALWQAYQKK